MQLQETPVLDTSTSPSELQVFDTKKKQETTREVMTKCVWAGMFEKVKSVKTEKD